MTEILKNNNDKMNPYLECSHKVFRYKFEKEIVDMLTYFAKLHQYDSKDDYKEAWKPWFESNKDIFEREGRRIINLGYNGNVEQKMYKAARYYFRRKGVLPLQTPNPTASGIAGDPQTTLEREDKGKDKDREKERSSGGLDISPKTTRKYVQVGHEILDAMDEHIKTNIENSDYTPASGFDDFCKNYAILLATEIISLKEKGETNKNYISSKIKKTYKNRYFQLRKIYPL